MTVTRPQRYFTEVTKMQMLNKRVFWVTLSTKDSTGIHFNPGQFVSLNVGNNTFRPYSICSDPTDTKNIQLIAAIDHEGLGSNYLKNLKQGDTVEIVGPAGRFSLPEPLGDTLIFVCTGTGIAPFISMLYTLQYKKYSGSIKLYFGIRDEEELFMLEELLDFQKNLPHFEFTVCFSQNFPSSTPNYRAVSGRVTSHLDVTKFPGATYLICGNPFMVQDTVTLLEKNQIPRENILMEHFTSSKTISSK